MDDGRVCPKVSAYKKPAHIGGAGIQVGSVYGIKRQARGGIPARPMQGAGQCQASACGQARRWGAAGEAGAIKAAIRITADIHTEQGHIGRKRFVEPARFEPQFVILDRFAIKDTLGGDNCTTRPEMVSEDMPPPLLYPPDL